jgi:hypothetical protein
METKRKVASAASILLLVLALTLGLFGCAPPVDLDRVPTLPASGPPEPEEVMPSSLLGANLTNLQDSSGAGYTGVTGIYDEVVVTIDRAANAVYTSGIMEDELAALESAAHSSSYTTTGDWFQFSGDVGSAFWWKKDNWVYGVFAPDDDTVIQAAEALIDHLVTLEY